MVEQAKDHAAALHFSAGETAKHEMMTRARLAVGATPKRKTTKETEGEFKKQRKGSRTSIRNTDRVARR